MYLKRIELQGFKTFAARTVLELRPGITAVVGPNGSGKSNIADAVRWALGEQNLRQVRCRATEELIFAGSARRASVGMAEVSLVFANEGGWLALPFTEVRVSRRAYRSGENEYLLNGTRVRLREVIDLLAGASIQAGGHVVVGQGLVDAVLALRAEERRGLVESLAGLKQYYLRRDDAETRLGATEANLVQVDAMIAELAPQVESLAGQAEAFRAFRAAEDELRALQRATFGVQAARVLARSAMCEDATTRTLGERGAAHQEVTRLAAEEDRIFAELLALKGRVDALRERLRAEQAAQATARRECEVAAARVAAARAARQGAEEEIARLSARVVEVRSGYAEAGSSYEATRTEVLTAEGALLSRRHEVRELIAAREAALAAHRALEAAVQEKGRTVHRLAEALTLEDARLEGQFAELARQAAVTGTALEGARSAERACGRAREALRAAGAALTEARGAEVLARTARDGARNEEAALAADCAKARQLLAETEARLRVAREWHAELQGYGAAVRSLATHPAVRGVVGELLEIDTAWQGPLAALLGPLLEALVTADPSSLLLVGSAMSGEGQVRVVVEAEPAVLPDHAGSPQPLTGHPSAKGCPMPLPDHAKGGGSQSPIPAPEAARAALLSAGVLSPVEALGWAAEVARAPTSPSLPELLRLDRVLLVRDAAAVLRCRPHLAALGVAVVAADGALAAGIDGTLVHGEEARVVGRLRRREELARLQQSVTESRAVDAGLRAALEGVQATRAVAESALESARRALSSADTAATRARDEGRFQERLLAQATQSARTAQAATERLRADLEVRRAHRGEELRRLDALRAAHTEQRGALDAAQAVLATAEERHAGVVNGLRSDESALVRLRDRLAAAAQLVEERRRGLAAVEGDSARHAAQVGRSGSEQQELEATLAEASVRAAMAERSVGDLERELCPHEALVPTLTAHQGALRAASAAASERLRMAERLYERARQEAERTAREREVLRAQVAAELGCTLEELPALDPPAGAVGRMRALRELLAGFGHVNGRAEEDFVVVSERLGFLTSQAEDLRGGVARLRGIISEANATVRERFAATVEALDRHFTGFFTRLFEGGHCRLIASFDERGLPLGMEIQAQPPGKRTRDLALLSGGERALVALALLFAMLKVRPVPFCLLDEVEAALDESNTGRFGTILRELSAPQTVGAQTQFVLITHNRGTMLHADHVYGVTMGESGISQVLGFEREALADFGPVDQSFLTQIPPLGFAL